jgi:hypothetical protein
MELYRLQENAERPVQVVEESEGFTSLLFPGLTLRAAEVFAD